MTVVTVGSVVPVSLSSLVEASVVEGTTEETSTTTGSVIMIFTASVAFGATTFEVIVLHKAPISIRKAILKRSKVRTRIVSNGRISGN